MLSADPRRRGRGRGRDIIDEAGPSTDTGTRPRRLTRAPSRFNDGASESESDSDLSDAEVDDDELHSNGDASEPWLPLLRRQQVLFGLFSLNRSMINSQAVQLR